MKEASVSRKQVTMEKIIVMLQEAEVALAQGKKVSLKKGTSYHPIKSALTTRVLHHHGERFEEGLSFS